MRRIPILLLSALVGCFPEEDVNEGVSVDLVATTPQVEYCWEIGVLEHQSFPEDGVRIVLAGWPNPTDTVVYDDLLYSPQTICRDLPGGTYVRQVWIDGTLVEEKTFTVRVQSSTSSGGNSDSWHPPDWGTWDGDYWHEGSTPDRILVGENAGTINVLVVSDSPGAVVTFQSPGSNNASGGGNGDNNGGGTGANADTDDEEVGCEPFGSFAPGTELLRASPIYRDESGTYRIDIELARAGLNAITQLAGACEGVVRLRVTTDTFPYGDYVEGAYVKIVDAPFGGVLPRIAVQGVLVPLDWPARIRLEVYGDPQGVQENMFDDDVLLTPTFELLLQPIPDPT